jgi:hypothetical protein
MKTRKGFHPIVVEGHVYRYDISLGQSVAVVYDDKDAKHILPFKCGAEPSTSWRGKHDEGGWGKREVARLIKEEGI